MKRQKVALVLSMGGARGIAHIGVIEELLEHGFEITSIAGTSMGAMVGAMYATGKMEECKKWMCSWDRRTLIRLADISPNREGMVKGDRFISELKQIIPDITIESLPLPYTALATDIVNECEVKFESGSLFDAIRASISIPMVFHPFKKDGLTLVDGGILNPLPLRHIRRTEGDIVVAVDVNAPGDARPLPRLSPYHLLSASSRMMTQEITRNEIRTCPPDILISIPASHFDMMEFYHAKEIIEGGRKAAHELLSQFDEKKNQLP